MLAACQCHSDQGVSTARTCIQSGRLLHAGINGLVITNHHHLKSCPAECMCSINPIQGSCAPDYLLHRFSFACQKACLHFQVRNGRCTAIGRLSCKVSSPAWSHVTPICIALVSSRAPKLQGPSENHGLHQPCTSCFGGMAWLLLSSCPPQGTSSFETSRWFYCHCLGGMAC